MLPLSKAVLASKSTPESMCIWCCSVRALKSGFPRMMTFPPFHMDSVSPHSPRMSCELGAFQELIARVCSESISQLAVLAGQPHSASDRPYRPGRLRKGDFPMRFLRAPPAPGAGGNGRRTGPASRTGRHGAGPSAGHGYKSSRYPRGWWSGHPLPTGRVPLAGAAWFFRSACRAPAGGFAANRWRLGSCWLTCLGPVGFFGGNCAKALDQPWCDLVMVK